MTDGQNRARAFLPRALLNVARRTLARHPWQTVLMMVILWAFAGIGVKQSDTAVVAGAAWVMTALMALVLVAGFFFHRRRSASSVAVSAIG